MYFSDFYYFLIFEAVFYYIASSGWPWTQGSTYFGLLSARMKDVMCVVTWFLQLFLLMFFFFKWDRVSVLCNFGCPEALYVDQGGLRLTWLCFLSAGIKVLATTPDLHSVF